MLKFQSPVVNFKQKCDFLVVSDQNSTSGHHIWKNCTKTKFFHPFVAKRYTPMALLLVPNCCWVNKYRLEAVGGKFTRAQWALTGVKISECMMVNCFACWFTFTSLRGDWTQVKPGSHLNLAVISCTWCNPGDHRPRYALLPVLGECADVLLNGFRFMCLRLRHF